MEQIKHTVVSSWKAIVGHIGIISYNIPYSETSECRNTIQAMHSLEQHFSQHQKKGKYKVFNLLSSIHEL